MKRRSHGSRPKKSFSIIALGGWILLCEAVGLVAGMFTIPQIPVWYATLMKPSFSPPNWVFGPVWTILYALMGIAAYRIWILGIKNPAVRTNIVLFTAQLVFNFLWSFIFFSLHSIPAAFVDISILWILIVFLVVRMEQLDKTAGYLMTPYLLWVSFAMVLNYSLWLLNP